MKSIELQKIKQDLRKQALSLQSLNIPEVISYDLSPSQQAGVWGYRAALSISLTGVSADAVLRGKADPYVYAHKLGLPAKIKGIPVIYAFDEIRENSWWSTDEWAALVNRSAPQMPAGFVVNQPYTDSIEALAMRLTVDPIHAGLEVLTENNLVRLPRGATLGGIVWEQLTGNPMIISNAHVFCPQIHGIVGDRVLPEETLGMPIYQCRPDRKIGTFARPPSADYAGTGAKLDVAVGYLDGGIDFNPNYFGSTIGTIDLMPAVMPELGETVVGIGRTTGYQAGTILSTYTIGFGNLYFRTSGTGSSGDSGSRYFLVRDGKYYPVGYHWGSAGSSNLLVHAVFAEDDLSIRHLPPGKGFFNMGASYSEDLSIQKVGQLSLALEEKATMYLRSQLYDVNITIVDSDETPLGVDALHNHRTAEEFGTAEESENVSFTPEGLILSESPLPERREGSMDRVSVQHISSYPGVTIRVIMNETITCNKVSFLSFVAGDHILSIKDVTEATTLRTDTVSSSGDGSFITFDFADLELEDATEYRFEITYTSARTRHTDAAYSGDMWSSPQTNVHTLGNRTLTPGLTIFAKGEEQQQATIIPLVDTQHTGSYDGVTTLVRVRAGFYTNKLLFLAYGTGSYVFELLDAASNVLRTDTQEGPGDNVVMEFSFEIVELEAGKDYYVKVTYPASQTRYVNRLIPYGTFFACPNQTNVHGLGNRTLTPGFGFGMGSSGYYGEGSLISSPADLSARSNNLKIKWIETVLSDTAVSIETAVTDSLASPAEGDWAAQLSGAAISNIPAGSLVGKYLWYRAKLSTTDASKTPTVRWIISYDDDDVPLAGIRVLFNGEDKPTSTDGKATFTGVDSGIRPYEIEIMALASLINYPSPATGDIEITPGQLDHIITVGFVPEQFPNMKASSQFYLLTRKSTYGIIEMKHSPKFHAPTWFVWDGYWADRRQIMGRVEIDFPAPIGTVSFDDDDIIMMRLLEEAGGEARSPLGFVTSNELTLVLNNVDRKFTPSNPDREYNVRPGLVIRPYLRIQGPAVTPYETPLGTFWCDEWDTPSDTIEATTVAHDRLIHIINKDTPQIPAMVNTTIREMFGRLFRSLDLSMDEFIINPRMDQEVKVGWFPRSTVGESLQLLAEAGNCFVSVNRDNQITVQPNLGIYIPRGTDFENNCATGATYEASLEGSVHAAFDEDTETSFYPNGAEFWVVIDFGSGVFKQIEKVGIFGDDSTTTAREWRLEGSTDNVIWFPLETGSLQRDGTHQEWQFSNIHSYRYFRLSIFSNYGAARTRLHDVRLHQRVAVPPILYTDDDMIFSINNPQRVQDIYTAVRVEYRLPFLRDSNQNLLRADKVLIPSTAGGDAFQLDRTAFHDEDIPIRQLNHIYLFAAENVGEVQELDLDGATAGTFLLGDGSAWSAPLAYNIAASALRIALEGLYGDGQVKVEGEDGRFNIEFQLSAGDSNLQGNFGSLVGAEDPGLLIVVHYRGIMTSRHVNTSFGATDITLWIENEDEAEDVDIQVMGVGTGHHISHGLSENQQAIEEFGYRELEQKNPLIQSQGVAEKYSRELLDYVADPLALFNMEFRGDPFILIGRPFRVLSIKDKVPEIILVPRRVELIYQDGGLHAFTDARKVI